jgi:hypothetical protein
VLAWWALPGPIGGLLAGSPGLIPTAQRVMILAVAGAVVASVTWAISLYDAVLVARYLGRAHAPRGRVTARPRPRRKPASKTMSAARSA